MKSNNKNILLLLMLYTCVLPVKGQNVYTLDECIEAALQNNVRIKNADNDSHCLSCWFRIYCKRAFGTDADVSGSKDVNA